MKRHPLIALRIRFSPGAWKAFIEERRDRRAMREADKALARGKTTSLTNALDEFDESDRSESAG